LGRGVEVGLGLGLGLGLESGLRLGLGVCRHGLHLQHAEGTARRATLPCELRARLRQGTLRL